MNTITSIQILTGSGQEILPGFSDSFPHTASRAMISRYAGKHVPWHWHGAVELFYIESGELEYSTPNTTLIFPVGTGGLVNSGVPHMTRSRSDLQETVQLVHLFDPMLISGATGGRIHEKYVAPLLNSRCEIFPLEAGNPILDVLRQSFRLNEGAHGYELRLRSALSEIWLHLADTVSDAQASGSPKANDKLKRMLAHVHEHYCEHIRIADLAAAAFVSERECYRLFHDHLHCSPLQYITGCRIQAACSLLQQSDDSITQIGLSCGFGTGSHFGKIFAEQTGISPRAYRRIWQDRDNNWHK